MNESDQILPDAGRRIAEKEHRLNEERLRSLVRILRYEAPSRQAFLDFALEEAILLTGSQIGYIYFYEEEKRRFILNTWSKEVMPNCKVINPQTCYDLDATGIWGEAVRQRKPILLNDFQAYHSLKKGCPEGHVPLLKYLTVPVFNGEAIVAVVGVANKKTDYDEMDILQLTLLMDAVWKAVERLQAEEEFRKLSKAVEQSPVSVVITDVAGRIEYINPKFTEVTGYTLAEVLGQNPRILKSGLTPAAEYETLWKTIPQGRQWHGEFHNRKKDGSLFWERACISSIRDASGAITHYIAVKEDITAEKTLQAQLLQARKMESVGRLAGGVAHDFNNMLQVIIGNAQLEMMRADPSKPPSEELREIMNAARRAADITRQLLAFARKQTITPQVLNINHTISGLIKMLQRLIGEDIEMIWKPGANLWHVRMDSSQIDQILANLSINARDAITGVGRLTIETENVTFDDHYAAMHAGLAPGQYVMLAITDTGCGMDKETLAHIFEPFFTTKDLGKGTGLGLATIYGIVKQNDGFINVYSEPGKGSVFKIYIPRISDGTPATVDTLQQPSAQGDETILLVEDDEKILKLAQKILSQSGYRVISVQSPAQALQLAEKHEGPIHLLVTDVIMPGMNGKDLTQRLTALLPGLKSVYMSGYTAEAISRHGVLDADIHFLQKPFSVQSLLSKVREALGH